MRYFIIDLTWWLQQSNEIETKHVFTQCLIPNKFMTSGTYIVCSKICFTILSLGGIYLHFQDKETETI